MRKSGTTVLNQGSWEVRVLSHWPVGVEASFLRLRERVSGVVRIGLRRSQGRGLYWVEKAEKEDISNERKMWHKIYSDKWSIFF
jgi:hypothetical protein